MSRAIYCMVVAFFFLLELSQVIALDEENEENCMTWAIRRIAGVPSTDPPALQNSTDTAVGGALEGGDSSNHNRGPARPGKRGAVGPRGHQGPPGPPGVCDCIPEEMNVLQKQHEELQEYVERIRKTSPESFCLLGMKNSAIPDSAISVSSHPSQKIYGRLDSNNAWYPSSLNPGHEWIIVDIGKVRLVTGVVTQGRYNTNQWVTKFKVEHSQNGKNFTDVTKSDRSEMIFNGNSDRHTKIVNRFPEPVNTRFVRIYPMSYSTYMSIRFDVIDC